jgi:hypothetical protein
VRVLVDARVRMTQSRLQDVMQRGPKMAGKATITRVETDTVDQAQSADATPLDVVIDMPAAAPEPAAEPEPVEAPPRKQGARTLLLAWIASIVWLAVVAGALIVMAQHGRFSGLDATNVAAIAAGVFTPLTTIWLCALALLRGGPLASLESRVSSEADRVLQPLERASHELDLIRRRGDRQLAQIEGASVTATDRFAALETASSAQAERLIAAAAALEKSRDAADAAENRLRSAIGMLDGTLVRLEAAGPRLADTITSQANRLADGLTGIDHAGLALATHTQQALQSAEDANRLIDGLDGRIRTTAGKLAEVLESLRAEAGSTSQALDQSLARADALLTHGREWLDTQMQAVSAGLETRQAQAKDLVGSVGKDVDAMASAISTALGQLEADIASKLSDAQGGWTGQLESVRTALATLDAQTSQANVDLGVKLMDMVTRTRRASDDAVAAARAAAESIRADVEGALTKAGQAAPASLAAVSSAMAQLETLLARTQTLARDTVERLAETNRDDLGRLSAQLIESLNSHAIDIGKVFADDIPDDDWRAYLAGDRSLFARRLVRLGDRNIRKRIADRLERDHEFREVVGRYITTFETLFGRMLDEPQARGLSVAILSSDVGKLYVLLGQASNRLPQ